MAHQPSDIGTVYFAWVEPSEKTFGPQHHRVDEEVFSLLRTLVEGDFPQLAAEVINPGVGLLDPSRKRWVWVSYVRPDETVEPLFFGRLVGVPSQLGDHTIELSFVARPDDYETRKEALAEQLRVLPWWDPMWLSESARLDPDSVLEARNALWCIDPVTHELVASDIITGDVVHLFEAGHVDAETVQISHTRSPARRAVVRAEVAWSQSGTGVLDLSGELKKAAASEQSTHAPMIDGQEVPTANMIVLSAGQELIQAWPRSGATIGGGWRVHESAIGPVGQSPGFGIVASEIAMIRIMSDLQAGDPATVTQFRRTPGLTVPLGGDAAARPAEMFPPPREVVWVPLWTLAATITVQWQAERPRTEAVEFEIHADVQPVVTDPGDDEETIRIELGPFSVDALIPEELDDPTEPATDSPVGLAPIRDPRRKTFFKTDRGRLAVEHAALRARAALLDRARCVEVSFESAFEIVSPVRLVDSATVHDPDPDSDLPGGTASGKVTMTQLAIDGDTGEFSGRVIISGAIGRGGEVVVTEGTPTYSEPDYGELGYEVWIGESHIPESGDIAFEDFSDQPIDDDGIDLQNINIQDYVVSFTMEGGMEREREQVDANQFTTQGWNNPVGDVFERSPQQVVDRIAAVTTTFRLEMRPVIGGPFATTLRPEFTELVIPRIIDLEGHQPTEPTE